MEERLKKILDNDPEEIKKVDVREPQLLELMQEVEEENRAREDVLDWLSEKKRRQELINDDELVQELLSHLEEAYRTAAISENAYADAKHINKELLS